MSCIPISNQSQGSTEQRSIIRNSCRKELEAVLVATKLTDTNNLVNDGSFIFNSDEIDLEQQEKVQ